MDWQKNRLLIGVVVLAALVGVSYYAFQNRTESDAGPADSSDATIPEIDASAVDEIVITRAEEGDSVTLTKTDGNWNVTAPFAAKGNSTSIATAVSKLGEIVIRSIAATKTKNHERLEVDEGHALKLVVRAGGSDITTLFLGKQQAGNTMTRVEGRDVVLAVKGSLRSAFDKSLKDWRDKTIIDETSSEIRELHFRRADRNLSFRRNAEDTWEQVLTPGEDGETPAGIDKFDAAKVQGIVTTLARMRAVNFAAPDSTPEATGLATPSATLEMVRITPATEATDDAPAIPESRATVTINLGTDAEDGSYLQRAGDEVIYVISNHYKDRVNPELSLFQESDEPPPTMAPGGMPGMPGMPGGGQIPPEVLQQLRQQGLNVGG